MLDFYELINIHNYLLLNLIFLLLNLFIYYFEKIVFLINKPLMSN